jgi:hypothetical protein
MASSSRETTRAYERQAGLAIAAPSCKDIKRDPQSEPTMSIFAVNYLCREVLRDHGFRAAMKADPARALAPLDLTDEERRALMAGDVGTLFRMGVNAFLMGYLARFEACGLNVEIYNQRMRAVKVDEIGQPVA